MSSIIVRHAERQDCEAILSLKKELAFHSKMGHLPMLSAKDLERDGFDTTPPCYQCLVAEEIATRDDINATSDSDDRLIAAETRRVIGYALFYMIYPVWEGKGLMLEDLCVSEDFRGQGVGKLLLQELGKIGVEGNYSRITLECLNWNPSQKFYKKNHGVDVTASEGWHLMKFSTLDVQKLAEM